MPQPTLRFRFREPTIDTNAPIADGTVRVDGFDLRVVAEGEADAWDAGFGDLVQQRAMGAPIVSIPAFPNRKFRLSYIYVNASSGIESPRDLEGRCVGILGWGNTAGIWARGALQHYYGVDLTAVDWRTADPASAAVAPGIRIQRFDGDLDAALVAGELDAVIEPNVLPSISRRDPRVRRLFADYKSEEQAYFKATGIFPISHAVTLRREFVDAHPDAPVALLKAFRQARDIAFDRIQGPDPQVLVVSWMSALLDEQRALMGDDYWTYNVSTNRRTLEALTQFAFEQGLTPHRVNYNEFFHPDAAALPGV